MTCQYVYDLFYNFSRIAINTMKNKEGVYDMQSCLYACMYIRMCMYVLATATNYWNVYYKLFEVEKFHGFHGFLGSISNHNTFPWNSCAIIGFDNTKLLFNCKCFPANYNLVLQTWNFSTLNYLQYTLFFDEPIKLL